MDTTKAPAAKDPEAIRKKILSDPNTAKIAENLGIPLEEYVDQVVHFVLNPHEEPNLYVAEDDALRRLGYEPPDAEAMGKFIIEAVTLAEAAGGTTEFVDGSGKKKPVHLPDAQAAGAAPGQEDSELKAELDKQRVGRGQQG